MLDVDLIKSMARSPVRDYVIPGLTSSLVGGDNSGCVRLFSQERDHEEPITPHSHRFDFQCYVLQGTVRNRLWEPGGKDRYQKSRLLHHGQFGKYTVAKEPEIVAWECFECVHGMGDIYAMKAEQIHSIFFSRDAEVLFFEGPNRLDHSFVLEPVSGGRTIPTFRVDDWMFHKG